MIRFLHLRQGVTGRRVRPSPDLDFIHDRGRVR